MKQYITREQLDEITQTQKEKLREWSIKSHKEKYPYSEEDKHLDKITFPLPNIGQMIEFLGWEDMQFFLLPSTPITRRKYKDKPDHLLKWHIQDGDYENAALSYFGETLCDALWEAIKEELKNY